MPTNVIATLRVPGFHRWPDALEEVIHLRDRHRHLFTFRVYADVTHNDRQIEFQLLQARMRRVLKECWAHGDQGYEFEAASCESLAQMMLEQIDHIQRAEVWEDDENGAEVTR